MSPLTDGRIHVAEAAICDNCGMEVPPEVTRQLSHSGYAVLQRRLDETVLLAARTEIESLLSAADWGSGFDGSRTRKAWALLAKTRCMDEAALDPLVLDVVEQVIGASAQFGLT
jgi:hypothetical protein